MEGSPFELRDYQRECLVALMRRYKAKVRRQLVSLPTGTGKTVIFSQFPRFFRMRNRMLVIAHRHELLEQAAAKMRASNPERSVAIEQGPHTAGDAEVVIASAATLGRQGSRRLERFNPEEFFLFVVDEAHHATAATYRRVLEHFGLFEPDTPKLLVGFTATPKRGDKVGLDAVFEEITFSRALPSMIEEGYLAPISAYRVETTVDLSEVKTRHGDFMTGQLSRAINIGRRNDVVVEAYRQCLSGRKTVCFCVDVAHARDVAAAFNQAGVPAVAVTGELGAEERAAAISGFRDGRFQVLTNCMVLTEGFDEPSITGILLARPTKSVTLYTQMIGRGTRLHPGKAEVTIVDLIDVTRDHSLVSVPMLFGLPSDFDLQGETTVDFEREAAWIERHRPWVAIDETRSMSELRLRRERVDLLDLRTPPELSEISGFAWSRPRQQDYRLALGHGEVLAVRGSILNQWEVSLRRGGREVERLGRYRSMALAVALADEFVREHRREAMRLVSRRRRWRSLPASEKQLATLAGFRLKIPEGITKGQASHLISMLRTASALTELEGPS